MTSSYSIVLFMVSSIPWYRWSCLKKQKPPRVKKGLWYAHRQKNLDRYWRLKPQEKPVRDDGRRRRWWVCSSVRVVGVSTSFIAFTVFYLTEGQTVVVVATTFPTFTAIPVSILKGWNGFKRNITQTRHSKPMGRISGYRSRSNPFILVSYQ